MCTIGKHYHVPDGYYPDGRSRPWREVEVVSINNGRATIRYLDTEETWTLPTYLLTE